MSDYTPYLTALLSGLLIPALIALAHYLKKQGQQRAEELRAAVAIQAEKVATEAATVALNVASAAEEAARDAEKRLSALLAVVAGDVKTVIERVDGLNGKLAKVTEQQGQDHDRVVWLLGQSGAPIDGKQEQPK